MVLHGLIGPFLVFPFKTLCFMLLCLVAVTEQVIKGSYILSLLALLFSVFQKAVKILSPLFCLPSSTT